MEMRGGRTYSEHVVDARFTVIVDISTAVFSLAMSMAVNMQAIAVVVCMCAVASIVSDGLTALRVLGIWNISKRLYAFVCKVGTLHKYVGIGDSDVAVDVDVDANVAANVAAAGVCGVIVDPSSSQIYEECRIRTAVADANGRRRSSRASEEPHANSNDSIQNSRDKPSNVEPKPQCLEGPLYINPEFIAPLLRIDDAHSVSI